MSNEQNLALTGKGAVLVVHGGAGAIARSRLTAHRERQCRAKLEQALRAGFEVIRSGGKSLDAVIETVKVMEDSPLFNAGRGSCLTRKGKIEMDAAVMEGEHLQAGAVAFLTCVKNPVMAARAVMDYSDHVLLVATGANAFARKIAAKAGLTIVDNDYFRTARAERSLERFLAAEKEAKARGLTISGLTTGASQGDHEVVEVESDPLGKKFGTVGAVGVDRSGCVASATSTGGIVGKDHGRVGDSPLIGSGTYADNQTCAVSCTGHGEHFIRNAVGHELSSLIRYRGMKLDDAVKHVFSTVLPRTGGDGGLISINTAGDYSMRFNTLGMYRGVLFADGSVLTAIYDQQ